MAGDESSSTALRATIKLGESDAERAKALSAAKVSIGKHARYVGQVAVQTQGGMGVTDEMRVRRHTKRTTMLDATFGNGDFHLKRYTALNTKAAA